MNQTKVIETEIWEKDPEKPGLLRFVKTKKVCEVFKELETAMKENDMMPDEYFSLSYCFDEKSVMPKDAYFIAYAQWGGNEGVYLEVEMMSKNGKQHFATGKTLGETEEDYDRMQAIAGFIYKSFAGFGRVVVKKEEKKECAALERLRYELEKALTKYPADNIDIVYDDELGEYCIKYHSDCDSFGIYGVKFESFDGEAFPEKKLIELADKYNVGHCF